VSYPTRYNPVKDKDGNEAYIEAHRLLKLKLKNEQGAARTIATLARFRPGVWEIKREPQHYYRNGQGWGFNAEIFSRYVEFGIVRVYLDARWFRLGDGKEQSLKVECDVERLIANFKPMTKYKQQGFEKQMLVPETFFRLLEDEKNGPRQPPPAAKPPTSPANSGGQLTLF
jgi:hypothetical protein